jgi:hypothetical protein
MKKYSQLLALAATASLTFFLAGTAGAATSSAMPTQTQEASVVGLNCTLCSDEMRVSLKKATGAKDLEPRLECGRIYFETDPGASFNEAALTFTLTANGFTLKGVRPVPESLAQIRAKKADC